MVFANRAYLDSLNRYIVSQYRRALIIIFSIDLVFLNLESKYLNTHFRLKNMADFYFVKISS
jgi:hypothetical protein